MNLSCLKKDVSELKNRAMHKTIVHVERKDGNLLFYKNDVVHRVYKPSPTAKLFHAAKERTVAVMGPYNSGKSSMNCAEAVMNAMDMPKCNDGIRRCIITVVRRTSAELESTTLRTWLHWCGSLGEIKSHKKPFMSYEHTFNDRDGQIELELLFLALNRPEDIEKLKSLETSHAWINEADGISKAVLDHMKARCGRFPAKKDLTESFRWKIRLDYNPPDIDCYLYKLFESDRPQDHKIFKQPPGLIEDESGDWIMNPDAENLEHMTDDLYYLSFSRGQTKEFIKVYCLGQYGAVMHGKKVHENYNDDLHAVESIDIDHDHPIYLGWDFGFTPACLLSQYINGQRKDIVEFTTDRMGLREFVTMIVKPFLVESCEGMTAISRSDPAGGDGSDELHQLYILNKSLADLGIVTEPAKTNNPIVRVDATNFFLNLLSAGNAAYILSKSGCPVLRRGFLGKYRRKRMHVIGTEQYRDLPEKLHPWSDIQDCGQYTSLEFVEATKPKPKISEIIGASSSEWV